MSTSILKALPGKLDIKRHSPSILYISASLAMSTRVLEALSYKLDIRRHSPKVFSMYICKYLYIMFYLHFVYVFDDHKVE